MVRRAPVHGPRPRAQGPEPRAPHAHSALQAAEGGAEKLAGQACAILRWSGSEYIAWPEKISASTRCSYSALPATRLGFMGPLYRKILALSIQAV